MTPTDKSGFPGGSAGKESTCNAGILGSISELGKSPGEGKVFWPGEFHELCSPWGHKELDMTERLPLPLSQTSYPTALYPGDGLSKADPPVSFYTHTHTHTTRNHWLSWDQLVPNSQSHKHTDTHSSHVWGQTFVSSRLSALRRNPKILSFKCEQFGFCLWEHSPS